MTTDNHERVQADKDFTSDKISETVRNLSLGTIGFFAAILISTDSVSTKIVAESKSALFVAALTAIATLAFDYLQYLCGYLASRAAASTKDGKYDTGSWPYRGRMAFFVLKQISVVAALGAVGTIFWHLWAGN